MHIFIFSCSQRSKTFIISLSMVCTVCMSSLSLYRLAGLTVGIWGCVAMWLVIEGERGDEAVRSIAGPLRGQGHGGTRVGRWGGEQLALSGEL